MLPPPDSERVCLADLPSHDFVVSGSQRRRCLTNAHRSLFSLHTHHPRQYQYHKLRHVL